MIDYEKIAEEVPGPEEVVVPPEAVAAHQREYLPVTHEKYQGLAAAKGYDQSEQRVHRINYSHEAMIDVLLAEPTIKQHELAKRFNRSECWISRIIGSDAFQAALSKRRDELTDPFLVATIEERFRGLAQQSLDIIAEKLETSKNTDLALKALDVSVKALGFGARGAGGGQSNQFIIQLPPKSANAADWAAEHGPMKQIGNG